MNSGTEPAAPFVTSRIMIAALSLLSFLPATGSRAGAEGRVTPQAMADAVHAVIEADRTVYTRNIVNRLQIEEKLIEADEHWKDEKALPLPSQMLRMGSELVAEKDIGVSYALLSLWPINKQNGAKTQAEKAGLRYIADHPGKNYYTEEELGGSSYFTAVYPDKAVAEACVSCHNHHKDTPRRDFKLDDVMGGVVVRIALQP
jgi:Protein of unknown function (DUF3365)